MTSFRNTFGLILAMCVGAGAGVSCCGRSDREPDAAPSPAPAPSAAAPQAAPANPPPAQARPVHRPAETASTDDEPISRDSIKIHFGIMPGDYEDDQSGVLVGAVTPGASAEAAGIQEGDRLMTWNGNQIKDVRSWMGFMAKHKPGDVVDVGVQRGGAIVPIKVTLKARQD